MKLSGAIIMMPRSAQGGPAQLLRPLLYDSAALWLVSALSRAGARHFLALCTPEDLPAAQAAFPADTIFVSGAEGGADALQAFLARCSGAVAVVTAPVFLTDAGARRLAEDAPLPAGEGGDGELWRIDAAALRAQLDAGAGLDTALQACGEAFGTGAAPERAVVALGMCSLPEDEISLARVRRLAVDGQVRRLQRSGVRVLDPLSVQIDAAVEVAPGATLLPGTILRGRTVIGPDCTIGPNTMIRDCLVGRGAEINASQCNASTIGDSAVVGPFAYIRPDCTIGAGVKVGDFVEVKNSTVGDGAKLPHLSYVGDADIGKHVNYSCGSITCNYDGKVKTRTVVGDGAFIGCNTNLVAPVVVGAGAYTAAGSTITDEIPAQSLGIARARQTVKPGWAQGRLKQHD